MRRTRSNLLSLLWIFLCVVVGTSVSATRLAAAAPAQAPKKPGAASAGGASPEPNARGPSRQPAGSGEPADSTAGAGAGTTGQGAADGVRTDVRESAIYGDRLAQIDKEIEDLKDRVFRSKARLSLLKETVLRGVMAGSRVVLVHRNRMGASFRLIKVVYILDGAQIFARSDDSGGLDQEDEIVVFDGNLPPGAHTATVELTYRGHGFGIFAYLNSYTFESRSTFTFTAPDNGAVRVTSVGYERGNMTTEMRDRPAVDWQVVPLDALGRPIPEQAVRSSGGGSAPARAGAGPKKQSGKGR